MSAPTISKCTVVKLVRYTCGNCHKSWTIQDGQEGGENFCPLCENLNAYYSSEKYLEELKKNLPKGNDGKEWPETFDASVWAKVFVLKLQENPDIVQEDCMIGWFSNAIMRGYDKGREHELDASGRR